MTSIRIDGQDKSPPNQVPRGYSIPLNSTSAINVHLMFQQQQQLMQQQEELATTASASTYVKTVPPPARPAVSTIAINTDSFVDTAVGPDSVENSSSIGVMTDYIPEPVPNPLQQLQSQPQSSNRSTLVSIGSEPDSARGSIPDDVSVHSSGSRGTTESLPDDFTKGLTALNINVSADDGIVTSPSSDQQEFNYVHSASVNGSTGSHSSLGSPTSPTSPQLDDKHVRFQNQNQKKWALAWDDDDTKSDGSWNNRFTDASSFILADFTDEETKAAEDADALKTTRVALFQGEDMTCMIKIKCGTEEMGFDLRVISLLQDILERCDQLGKNMKGSAVRLTPFHLNKMNMKDGRPAKERAAEVSRILEGDLILCEAVCQKHAERLHISTDIRNTVYEKGPFVVGKQGILVTLWKKHKYAVAKEFSGPLCDHIYFYRPHLLGNNTDTTLKKKRKATDTVRRVLQSPLLLAQMFKTDPTITVGEAARRSFVDVIFYALYE